jgi:hypothetical protein
LWGLTQARIGNAHLTLSIEEPTHVELAIAAYQNALEALKREDDPISWATASNNLGLAYVRRRKGDPNENARRAVDALESALEVRSLETMPIEHRQSQVTLGDIWFGQRSWDRALRAYAGALAATDRLYVVGAVPEIRQDELVSTSNARTPLPTV